MTARRAGPGTIDLVAWLDWFRDWRDTIRLPYLVIALAMAAVFTGSIVEACGADVPAWTNGIAAIITAVAAIAESRHARSAWIDHETRLRVIETKVNK